MRNSLWLSTDLVSWCILVVDEWTSAHQSKHQADCLIKIIPHRAAALMTAQTDLKTSGPGSVQCIQYRQTHLLAEMKLDATDDQ